jgi:hypothetical protein
MNPAPTSPTPAGSLDGSGAGDHDRTYEFGRRPCAIAPYPFSTRQYARLLILRGRLSAGPTGPHPRARRHSGVLESAGA